MEIGKIGLWARPSRVSVEEWREAAAELDELGFGALWLGAAQADLELPAELLAATGRMTIATGIVSVWEQPAADLAANHRRVGEAYPDRFLLGLGASHARFVEARGQSYHRPYQKLVTYLDELDVAGVPSQGRVLAALGPRVLSLAGRRSRGAHPYFTNPSHSAQAREILGNGPLLAPEQMVVLQTDPERARTIARAAAELYLGLPNYRNSWRRLGFSDDDFADGGSDRFIDEFVAWGDLEAVGRRVAEHHAAGADHVCIQVLTDDADGLPRAQWRELSALVDRS